MKLGNVYRVKTHEELLASGWVYDKSSKVYTHILSGASVVSSMLGSEVELKSITDIWKAQSINKRIPWYWHWTMLKSSNFEDRTE